MPIWSDSYLQQLVNDGETDIVNKVTPIFERVSLSVTSGTATYTLPDYIIKIVQVTWKGTVLDNLVLDDLLMLDPKYRTNKGKPIGWTWSQDGLKIIRFFPVVNETIAADNTNIYGSDIANRVILSYFRSPDTTQSNLQIPAYMGRRAIKPYVLWKAFMADGLGQNIKASDYFKAKYRKMIRLYALIKRNYYNPNKFPPIHGQRISRLRPELRRDITITP
jgi:hypothetical protein